MSGWIQNLFVEHSDLFLKLLDLRWDRTEQLVNGMVDILKDHGITSGNLLDLCCGNGRVSVHMAKRGFRAVGVDISQAFIKEAKSKAEEHRVSDAVTFLQGDVRKLKEIVSDSPKLFDVIVNVWTSVGYYPVEEDLSIFKQARELSRAGAILLVAETMHTEYLSLKFTPTSFMELGNMIMLESREYDPMDSNISASWTFYEKEGNDLKFRDRVEYELHIYSPRELCTLLRKAGWKTVATYGSLSTQQQRSPLGSLNVVAKAQ